MVTFSTALATSRAGGRGRVPDRGELIRFNHYMKRFGAMHVCGAKEYAKIGGRAPLSINTQYVSAKCIGLVVGGANISAASFGQETNRLARLVTRTRSYRFKIAIVLTSMLALRTFAAQSTFGSIGGSVQDTSGAVVPGVAIKLTKLEENTA